MQQEQAPTRSLPLAGATNFRDLGGYTGHGGRPVKWRRIFRSDHLAALTPKDQALLADLGVARAVDFRGQAESAAYAYSLPGVQYHPLHIEPTVVQRALELQRTGRQLTAQDAVGLMQDTYRGFVHDNAPRFAELFRLLGVSHSEFEAEQRLLLLNRLLQLTHLLLHLLLHHLLLLQCLRHLIIALALLLLELLLPCI